MMMHINLSPKGGASKKMYEPLVEAPKRRNEMPDAVKVAIVRAGCFCIIYGKRAKRAHGETLAQSMEMLGKATDEEILDLLRKGYIKIPMLKWKTEDVRRIAIRAMVTALGKDARETTDDDFRKNGLGGLMGYYHHSRYKAIRDAGYGVNAWEMGCTPRGFWDERENRIAAIKWLMGKLEKKVCEMTPDDFKSNSLRGLLLYYYRNPSHEAMKDAELIMEAKVRADS